MNDNEHCKKTYMTAIACKILRHNLIAFKFQITLN